MLNGVMAPCQMRVQNVSQIMRVMRASGHHRQVMKRGPQSPDRWVFNLDRGRGVVLTRCVPSGRRMGPSLATSMASTHGQAGRGVNDPTGRAWGHPRRAEMGSFTPRLLSDARRPGSDSGGNTRRPFTGAR